jgi:hypothetical protein
MRVPRRWRRRIAAALPPAAAPQPLRRRAAIDVSCLPRRLAMNDLIALNLFALSLPAALIGMGLFGGLMLLPLFFRDHTGA